MFETITKDYADRGYLLLDEWTVAKSENCRLMFGQAVKDPVNPIVKATEPWEGCGCTTWGGNLLRDKTGGWYRMYYGTFEQDDAAQTSYYRGGAVESVDGLHWEKPANFKTVYRGIPTTYSVRQEGDPVGPCGAKAVYDPRPECPAQLRYKALRFHRGGGVYLYCSADGITWKLWSEQPVWMACSDIIHPLWDERLKKFICYFKLWKLYAQEKDDTAPGGFRPITALTYGENATRDLPDGTTEIKGMFVTLHPESKAQVAERTFLVKSGPLGEDDGGGSQLSGAWHMRRVIHRAESDDFIHWEHEQEVLDTDEQDRPTSNIQLAHVFRMGGYYLAFLSVHDERGHFDQQLAFSHDGIHWKRPWRGNVLGVGAPGSYDGGMAAELLPPVVLQNQFVFYYGGYSFDHTGNTGSMGICRALMRKDGLAFWKAWGEPALLETVALTTRENALYLNVDAEAGWLTAALLDADGNVLMGYDHEDCERLRADSASHPGCELCVRWNGSDKLPETKCLRVQLRFQNATVYSIRI